MTKIYEDGKIKIYEDFEGYYNRYENDKYVGTYTDLELAKVGGPSNVIVIG